MDERLIALGLAPLLVLLHDPQVMGRMDGQPRAARLILVEGLDEGDVVEALVGVLHDRRHGQHRR